MMGGRSPTGGTKGLLQGSVDSGSSLSFREQPHVVHGLPRQPLFPPAPRPPAPQAVPEQPLLRREPRLRRAPPMVPRPEPVRELEGEARHPLERVPRMGPPSGVFLWREVRLQPRRLYRRAARSTPIRPVPRDRLYGRVLGDLVQEGVELGRVVPGPARHPDRQRGPRRRPGEDVDLREIPPGFRIVVRPPRAGADEDEARGVHRQDLLDRPEGARSLREQALERTRDPVAAVVLLQRVEVRDAGEPDGRLEELEEADGAPEAQVEVRPEEEAEHEFSPRDSRAAPVPSQSWIVEDSTRAFRNWQARRTSSLCQRLYCVQSLRSIRP